jgi:hypothetical protein
MNDNNQWIVVWVCFVLVLYRRASPKTVSSRESIHGSGYFHAFRDEPLMLRINRGVILMVALVLPRI